MIGDKINLVTQVFTNYASKFYYKSELRKNINKGILALG